MPRLITPVEWVVIDASPINVFDVTALKKFDDLIEELKARGIVLALACEKRTLEKFFELKWVKARRQMTKEYRFHTLESAVHAFNHRGDRRKYGSESNIY